MDREGETGIQVIDLGRISYAAAYQIQSEHLARVVASRDSAAPILGVILLVEHDPVITVSRRAGAEANVIATSDALRVAGVDVQSTDRGGDVTYHGPGQLVAYPIVDLNAHGLRIIDYIRLLEGAIVDTLSKLGVKARTDPAATGVWTAAGAHAQPDAKIAAIGVRVRQWVSMHGLSLNVDPDMRHFNLIVPCGLHGRAVTSLRQVLGERCPSLGDIKPILAGALRARLDARWRQRAEDRR